MNNLSFQSRCSFLESYVTLCVSHRGRSSLLSGLSLHTDRFTADDVPGRNQASVAMVSTELCLSRAEDRDRESSSSAAGAVSISLERKQQRHSTVRVKALYTHTFFSHLIYCCVDLRFVFWKTCCL